MATVNKRDVQRGFDLALLAFGLTPSVIATVVDIREALEGDGEVESEQLDALIDRLQERSERIQAA